MELQRITKHTNPSARREKWHVVDAEGERLGRLATKVAGLLQGKHRPDYSRHQLSEDFVIVVNAAKIGVSGAKMAQKVYHRHSGYPGGMRTRTLEEMLARFPARVVELAVKGMLPRNRLGRRMLRRLKVYADAAHPHEAQVRIGMGKPKQAPAAPAPSRRRRPAPTEPEAPPSDAPEAEAETAEERTPSAEEPQAAAEQEPAQGEPEEAVAAERSDNADAETEQAEAVAEEQPEAAAAEPVSDADAETEQSESAGSSAEQEQSESAAAERSDNADIETEQAEAVAEETESAAAVRTEQPEGERK